jgi:aldehyde:ferredoxin oxidoreductase
MIAAAQGISLTVDEFMGMGASILKKEKAFNTAAGFTNEDDRLPEFFEYEPVPPHNAVWDFTGAEIDEVWNF